MGSKQNNRRDFLKTMVCASIGSVILPTTLSSYSKGANDKVQLFAGVSCTEITPPFEVGLLTSSVNQLYEPFESVRLPLKARVLALKSGYKTVVIVSLDLLGLTDTSVGGWDNFKQKISGDITPENVIITCTHTHNGPESVALSNLYLKDAYQNWLMQMQLKVKQAIHEAVNTTKPCNVSLASSKLENYSMQRRISTDEGIIMSDSVQPISAELLDREPIDRRVNIIRLSDFQGKIIATVVHAICHPVHEMCIPHISSEFPGEMCRFLEKSPENGMPFFWNGAAGDINPPTVSCGPEYAFKHGQALASLAMENQEGLMLGSSIFRFINNKLQFPVRSQANITNKLDAVARFGVIRIGSMAIVFLPGEPFVEIALEIEKNSPFEYTLVVAYAENSIGYIPTRKAFNLGGYEVGPGKWSFLEKGTDEVIIKEALHLLSKLYNNEAM